MARVGLVRKSLERPDDYLGPADAVRMDGRLFGSQASVKRQEDLDNLRNYLNLRAVAWPSVKINGMDIKRLGVGSGMIGLPGDFTPPSRFVRAVAFWQTARETTGGYDTAREIFRILDNFNVPIQAVQGGTLPEGLKPLCCSGTQYATAVDLKNLVIYYHTDTDRTVRKIDLKKIDFGATSLQPIHQPLRVDEEGSVKDVTPAR